MSFNIAHIIHSSANAIATFFILSLHCHAFVALPDAHSIPPTIIIINDTSIITVTSILVATLTIVGNALRAAVSLGLDFCRQFHKNGIDVFNGIHLFFQSPFALYLQVQYEDHTHLCASHLLKLQVFASASLTKRLSHEYLVAHLLISDDTAVVPASLQAFLSSSGVVLQSFHHHIDGVTYV
jgi:hypothetical protein